MLCKSSEEIIMIAPICKFLSMPRWKISNITFLGLSHIYDNVYEDNITTYSINITEHTNNKIELRILFFLKQRKPVDIILK